MAILPPMKYRRSRERAHAELADVLPQLFRRVVIAMPNEVAGFARITPEQFSVLTLLGNRGPLSMTELAAARRIALNTTSSLVDRLFAAGLVTRGGDPKDRRVVRVEITLKGRALVERLRAARHDAMRRLLEELTDEQVDQVLAAMPALGRLAGLPVTAAVASPAAPPGAGSEGALAPRPLALR